MGQSEVRVGRFVTVRAAAPLFVAPETAEDAEMDQVLESWGRWCRLRPAGPRTCTSAEKNFRIDDRSWRYPHLRARPQVLESHRVLMQAVDGSVRQLPDLERQILKSHYVFRADPRRVCRRLSLEVRWYAGRLLAARRMVRSVLERSGIAIV